MPIGDGNLVPDRIPDWLKDSVRKSKGRDMRKYSMLGEFYKETQVVADDKFDRSQYRAMLEKADELKDLKNSRFGEDPSFENIVQDEFLGMYKSTPKMRDDKDMKPTHKINHAVLKRATSTREWEELLTYTQLDEWTSALAAVDFGLKLKELFDEQKELMQLQEDMNDTDQKVKDALDKVKRSGEGDMEDALDALEDALGDYDDASGNVDNGIKKHGNQLRQMGRQAAKSARDETEKSEALVDSFGTEPGALQRMDASARMALAARIRKSSSLRELADKVGRFVRLAMAEQAQKIVHGIDEVHDIELGNDIHKVLPSELVYLSDDDLDILFLKKFADKELMQYELRGKEKVARGAIICMIDSSGSMMGARDTWARAVAIALLHIAYRQKRDFYGIIFSSAQDPLLEFSFPKGIAGPSEVLDFAEASLYGGTDFELPINRAVEVLESQFSDEGSQKGDLVMITDGECMVSENWLDTFKNQKDHLAFRLYSCLIGSQSSTLNAISVARRPGSCPGSGESRRGRSRRA